MYDAIVIGGGLVGSALAYYLVGQGAKTVLIDRGDEGQATAAAAGILSPETSTNDSETWFEFAVRAVADYPALIEQLEREQSGETGYARCGKLTVAVTDDELGPFERTERQIFERQHRRNQPSLAALHPVSEEQAQAMMPLLGPVQRALYYRDAARVDGELLSEALRRAASQRGLALITASVDRLLLGQGRVKGVVVAGEALQAGRVAIAGGAWSSEFGAQIGGQIPVEPQRGQIAHLWLPEAVENDWPIVGAFRGHYLIPWPDGRVVAGATREYGAGYAPHLTAGGLQMVFNEALRVAPGLVEAQLQELRVGFRPRTEDRLPVLGPVPGVAGLYLATGHGPTGLQLGPYSAKIVADLMLDRPPEADISPFGIERFWE